MTAPRALRIVIALLLLVPAAACGPSVPRSLPKSSAASPSADEAPVSPVGAALRSDPPLPGDGAGDGDAGASAHHHHHVAQADMGPMDGGFDAR